MGDAHTDDEIDALLALCEEDEERAALRRRVRRNIRHLLRGGHIRHDGRLCRITREATIEGDRFKFLANGYDKPQIINALKHGAPA